jgi:hypothetical protein
MPSSHQDKGIKMKKVIVSVMLATLILQGTANAAVIKGSSKSCKVGTVKFDSKYKYVCVMSGIWKKTLLISKTKKQPIKPTPAPATTPTPTPTPTPSVVAVPQIPKLPELSEIQKIYSKVINYYNHKNNFKLTVIKSPGVNSKRVDEIVTKYETALNSYSFTTNKQIKWVFMDETERQWYINKSLEIDSHDWTSWWDSGKCQISSSSVCAYGNANTNNPIFYMMIGSKTSWREHDQMIAEHEAVHMYQTLVLKTGHPNCWVMEGQANAIGLAMASKYSSMNDIRSGQIWLISRFLPNYISLSKEQWVDTFKKIEADSSTCFKNGAGYSIGMLAMEALFLNYDVEKVDQFVIHYSTTKNFDNSLRATLNIGSEDFYLTVADYIYKTVGRR